MNNVLISMFRGTFVYHFEVVKPYTFQLYCNILDHIMMSMHSKCTPDTKIHEHSLFYI